MKNTFFFLKLPLALSFLGHGLVRIPKLKVFAQGMATEMSNSILPGSLVLSFGYMLPFLETVVGIALITGYQTRNSILAGLGIMSLLVMGSCSIEN